MPLVDWTIDVRVNVGPLPETLAISFYGGAVLVPEDSDSNAVAVLNLWRRLFLSTAAHYQRHSLIPKRGLVLWESGKA